MTNTENNEHVTMPDVGHVRIATDVIARIAGIAAMDVEGVKAIGGGLDRDALCKAGKNALSKGVKTVLDGNDAKVDIAIIMDTTYRVPETCREVQKKISDSLTNMTGLNVSDVNVRVAGIKMQEA